MSSRALHREPDIRIIEGDHFLPFRSPEVIAALILEPPPKAEAAD